MAVLSFLLNASKQTPSLQTLINQDVQYLELDSAGYQIPLSWLAMFKPRDFVEVSVKDNNGNYDTYMMPTTTVEKARKNLESSFSYLSKFIADEEATKLYIQNTIKLLDGLKFDFIILDATGYLMCAIDEKDWHKFPSMFDRENTPISFIKEYIGYVDGINPNTKEMLVTSDDLNTASNISDLYSTSIKSKDTNFIEEFDRLVFQPVSFNFFLVFSILLFITIGKENPLICFFFVITVLYLKIMSDNKKR